MSSQYRSLTASHVISVLVTHCFTCHLSTGHSLLHMSSQYRPLTVSHVISVPVTYCVTCHLSTGHSLLHMSSQYWSLTASHVISVPATHCFTCHLSTGHSLLHMSSQYRSLTASHVISVLVTHCFTCHLSTSHSLLHMSSQYRSLTASHVISVLVTHCVTCHLSGHKRRILCLVRVISNSANYSEFYSPEMSENLKIIFKMANCVTGTHSNLIVYTRWNGQVTSKYNSVVDCSSPTHRNIYYYCQVLSKYFGPHASKNNDVPPKYTADSFNSPMSRRYFF